MRGALLLLLAVPGLAQDQGYVRRFYPSAVLSPYLTLDGTQTHGAGNFGFSAMGTFESRPLIRIDGDDGQQDIVGARLTTDLTLAYAPLEWLDVGVAVPLVAYQRGRNIDDDADLSAFAFGDPGLSVKGRLLDKDEYPLGVALLVGASLPFGDAANFAGEANATALAKLMLEYAVSNRVDVTLNGGWRFRERTRINQVFVDDELLLGLGASWRFKSNLALVGDLAMGTRAQGAFLVKEETPGDANVGLRWNLFEGAQLVFGGGVGFLPGVGSPSWRLFVGFEAVPRRHDFDADRVADGVDECLETPGVPENAGCPPKPVARPKRTRPKRKDADNDGVADAADLCPRLPEDRDGFRDDDGCPDPDNDLDFVTDAYDADALGPEDWDGFEDDDGIPDLDNDRDGVADYVDGCPDEAGGRDGCPGSPPAEGAAVASAVSSIPRPGGPDAPLVLGEMIHPGRPILFEFARPELTEDGARVVEALADFITSHPELGRIEVGVHVDSMGSRSWKHGLSRRRAKSVRKALMERGVDGKRLVARGYGPEVPVATNKDKPGRFKNRRVELRLLRGMPKGYAGGGAGKPLPKPRARWLPGDAIVLRPPEPILFVVKKPQLTVQGQEMVRTLAAQLQANQQWVRVEVGVHTDGMGSASWKKKLSRERARVVADTLTRFGVARDRLVPKGYGATRRIAGDETKESRFRNRRVELVVLESADEAGGGTR